MKQNLVIINVLVSLIAGIFVLFGFVYTFAYEPPKHLKEVTGTVLNFKQHDETWLDVIIPYGNRNNDYFRVKLDSGSQFEATGTSYGMIDRALFKDLRVGEEIKITCSGGKIYGIEYQGKEYLSLDGVLSALEAKAKIWHIVGPIIVAAALLAGGPILFFANYRAKKEKAKEKTQKHFL